MSEQSVMEWLNEWARAETERLKPAYNEQVRRELDFLKSIGVYDQTSDRAFSGADKPLKIRLVS